MKITKSARRDARQLFRSCIVNGVLDEARVRQALEQVIEVRPRGYLGILTQFQRLIRLEVERRSARVDSSIPLPSDLASAVTANLNQTYGDGLAISFAQNPALIGGLRIKVGSDVYDGSIQGRLEKLAETF